MYRTVIEDKRLKKMIILAVVVLILCMLSVIIVKKTAARYSADIRSSDTARVAIFAFDLNGTDIGKKNIEFDLFDTGEESVIIKEDGTWAITPIAKGVKKLILANEGEIDICARWMITEKNERKRLPLQYAITDEELTDENTKWVTFDENSSDNIIFSNVDTIYIEEKSIIRYLHWRWNPDYSDEQDCQIGNNNDDYNTEVTLTCTVEQCEDNMISLEESRRNIADSNCD